MDMSTQGEQVTLANLAPKLGSNKKSKRKGKKSFRKLGIRIKKGFTKHPG